MLLSPITHPLQIHQLYAMLTSIQDPFKRLQIVDEIDLLAKLRLFLSARDCCIGVPLNQETIQEVMELICGVLSYKRYHSQYGQQDIEYSQDILELIHLQLEQAFNPADI